MNDKDYPVDYDLDTLLNELPISLAYEEDTNNAKLLSLYADWMVSIQQELQKIDDWRDIDNAQGQPLDMIGNDRGVPRNGADDNLYRFMIKSKRLQRMTDGTYDSIIKLVAQSLGADNSEINVLPMYESSDVIHAIEITNIPGDYIDDERKEQLLFDQIQMSLAAGIRLYNIEFVKQFYGHIYLSGYAQSIEHDVAYMNDFYDQSTESHERANMFSYVTTSEKDIATMKGGN